MLSELLTSYVLQGPLPLGEDVAEAIKALPLRELKLLVQRAVDLLGDGFGDSLEEEGVPRADIPAPLRYEVLARDAGFMSLVEGRRTLVLRDDDEALVRLCQRAMQAVSARVQGAPIELALPVWGADGDFGAQTMRALARFRAWRGLPDQTRSLRARDAQELHTLLKLAPVPVLWASAMADSAAAVLAHEEAVASAVGAGAARIAAIARAICASTEAQPYQKRMDGRMYRYTADIFGVQVWLSGLLRAPGGVAYSLSPSRNYWKCNIFGGTVLSLAELPVPTFLVNKYRHYPRAERFGPWLARKAGWTMVKHLDHRNPEDETQALTGATQQADIEALLRSALPGDLLFVDHPGEPGEEGGHTRICVEVADPGDPDAAPLFAQARREEAREERDGLRELGGGAEIQFWLVRYES